ncbi:MAG: carboxy terminal-processing peptidase [Alphaproteobacteria bacterium]|nr:carboxy terminal-processing peptidase [Alphaproteobacteria bacterium]
MPLSSLGLLGLLLSTAQADAPARARHVVAPESHHGLVAGIVAAGLSEYHYASRRLDDDVSACWFDAYVDQLDPNHMYLSQADLAPFEPWRTRLDDAVMAMPPDLGMPYLLHSRFRDRLAERVDWTRKALETRPDLTNDESLVLDRRDQPREPDDAALRDLWRRDLEDEWLREIIDGGEEDGDGGEGAPRDAAATDEEIRKTLRTRMDRLEKYTREVEPADVLEGWLSALASCYDPHSVYFAPMAAEDFQIDVSGSLEGIGASLQTQGEYVLVKEVLDGGPADRSDQLHTDDRIVGVGQGDQGEMVDVVGMDLDHVVRLIRGPKGTTVRLEILPGGGHAGKSVIALVRDRIDLQEVTPKLQVRDVVGHQGKKTKVAWIEVPAFVGEAEDSEGGVRAGTTEQVRALLASMDPKVDVVLVDLRENGGGLLDEAVGLTGLFIDKGPVVQIRDGQGRIQVESDRDAGRAWDGPLVVLTSPVSASASEIFAGAIQDYQRGVIVGADATYGKGSVQTVFPLDPVLEGMAPDLAGKGGVLKLTFSMYYLPGGRSTQADGVLADVVLPMPGDGRVTREAERPHALPPGKIPAARFKPERSLASTIQAVKAESNRRVAQDERLAAIRELNTELAAQEDDSTVALSLDARTAQQAEWKEMRDRYEAVIGKDDDPVLDEALHVAADLATMGLDG